MTVAVIDLGFGGLAAAQAAGDVPNTAVVQDYCDPAGSISDEVHGTAVAEIVHEVAPGARLLLICIDSEVDLATAEAFADAEGATVINHSVGWFGTSRGDGTGGPGTPEAVVADAQSDGIVWVNAAGNSAGGHWAGAFSDPDGDGEMVAGTVAVGAGRSTCIELDWDAWPETTVDFDLYLVSAGSVVDSSVFAQADTPDTPTEVACAENSGAAPVVLDIFVVAYATPFYNRPIEIFEVGDGQLGSVTSAGSVVEPASSPAALAVGAACIEGGPPRGRWRATALAGRRSTGA